MLLQILSTSTTRNVWRTLRRLYILILGLKGLKRDSDDSVALISLKWNTYELAKDVLGLWTAWWPVNPLQISIFFPV